MRVKPHLLNFTSILDFVYKTIHTFVCICSFAIIKFWDEWFVVNFLLIPATYLPTYLGGRYLPAFSSYLHCLVGKYQPIRFIIDVCLCCHCDTIPLYDLYHTHLLYVIVRFINKLFTSKFNYLSFPKLIILYLGIVMLRIILHFSIADSNIWEICSYSSPN